MDQFTPFDRRSIPGDATIGRWAAKDGWPLRRFDWPAGHGAHRGSILFLGGRGDIFEKYLETFAHWHRRGWTVSSFDWRGQGGSGRLAANPNVGHASDFAPWIDDLADFFAEWSATRPGPHVVVTHSMGGHLVLRALAEGRIAPEAVAMTAPMLGLYSKPLSPRAAGFLARVMARIGAPDRPAWKTNERPSPPGGLSRQALLTHDLDRYADELWWKDNVPGLALGPPSWTWLATAYASTLALEQPGRLEAILTPILLVGAGADRLVDPVATKRAARRLPHAQLTMFGAESAHEILRESDPVRDRTLALIDDFLDAQAPAQ